MKVPDVELVLLPPQIENQRLLTSQIPDTRPSPSSEASVCPPNFPFQCKLIVPAEHSSTEDHCAESFVLSIFKQPSCQGQILGACVTHSGMELFVRSQDMCHMCYQSNPAKGNVRVKASSCGLGCEYIYKWICAEMLT